MGRGKKRRWHVDTLGYCYAPNWNPNAYEGAVSSLILFFLLWMTFAPPLLHFPSPFTRECEFYFPSAGPNHALKGSYERPM